MMRGSLQRRLLAVVLAASVPVFLIHLAVQISDEMRTARTGAANVTRDIAAAAVPLLQSTLVIGDLATTQEMLDNVVRDGEFRYLRLLGPNGLLVIEGRPASSIAGAVAPGWFVKLLDLRFERRIFPIRAGGVDYGILEAEPSPVSAVAEIWERMWLTVGLWLVTIVVMMGLIWLALRRGLRPLHDLAHAAHRFGDGDLECRAPVSDVPELAETAIAFNRMAENISEGKDRLEGRVRQRTAELAANEARTRAILRNLGDGVVQIDTAGRILLANHAVCALFGYAEEELLGQNVSILMPEPTRSAHDRHLARYLETHQPAILGRRREVEGRRKDGGMLSLELKANELFEEGGRTFIGVLRDISQQKAAEAAREAARADAERLALAKSDFLANMSHEIRTPLNAVLGFARMGARDSCGLPCYGTFGRIQEAGSHLLGVINEILDYSKIEAGKMSVEAQPFKLARVLANARDFLSESARQKGLAFGAEMAASLPAWVVGDALRLQQILMNLLSNAFKFTAEGEVRLVVAGEGENIYFKVIDTGIGMDEGQIGRLFKPFEQADGSTTRRYGGTGLGLAISQNLAHLMGGEIGVDSAPGAGTAFTLRLPLPEAAAPAGGWEDEGAAAHPAQRLAGLRVLAAEDIEFNRLILADLLDEAGADCVFAADGLQAVARVRENPAAFDVVLMDVQMPGMDGYEATRQVRALAPALPVIGLTAHALKEEREKCLASGMVDHVTKPIMVEQLLSAILRWTRRDGEAAAAQPLPEGAPAGQEGIDLAMLEARFRGDRGFIRRLLDVVVRDYGQSAERLRQLAEARDYRGLAALAHSLKGVCGNLGAAQLQAQSAAVEQAARAGDAAALAQVAPLAAGLEKLIGAIARRLAGAEAEGEEA